MSSRRAACDSCQRSKVGCDHKRPVCTRCLQTRKATTCTYRTSPFKRKRRESNSAPNGTIQQSSALQDPCLADAPLRRRVYPNPGHLGSSSHVTIFNHIHYDASPVLDPSLSPTLAIQCTPAQSVEQDPTAFQGAELLQYMLNNFDLASMKDLVMFWLAKGVSLALAEPLVEQCVKTMDCVRKMSQLHDDNWHLTLAHRLLQNSDRPLEYNKESTLSSFTTQFCDDNVRWETIGIFLSTLIRATFDIPFFPPLYTTEKGRQQLLKSVTRLSAYSLEICLSLDCLNDLQLIFQYENFIVNSYVHGDQSLHSWRSLGDVIASAFALGYHEDIQAKPDVPQFLVELRRTAFARIYSADKNVAIFLGRPPRMSKRFSCFQIPSGRTNLEIDVSGPGNYDEVHDWDPDTEISYRAESRWSALCASIKEDILELLFGQDHSLDEQKASGIAVRAAAQWQALPTHFRLSGSLRRCTRTPFERDFLVSTRLNHLHVQFLLRLALLKHLAEPDTFIVEISQQILALVVETILFRDNLANSGTGLIWKIAHYGLPAAGIVLLAMLKQRQTSNTARSPEVRVWQDLNILVAEVQMGSIVRLGEANYPLLSKATQTIQMFLKSITSSEESHDSQNVVGQQEALDVESWFPHLSPDPWNLEIAFWENLAEHPFLSSADPEFWEMR